MLEDHQFDVECVRQPTAAVEYTPEGETKESFLSLTLWPNDKGVDLFLRGCDSAAGLALCRDDVRALELALEKLRAQGCDI